MQHSYLSKFLKNTACIAMMALAACALPACSDNDEPEPVIQPTASGLFIVNEGNYGAGNATLSYFSPETNTVAQEVFYRANDARLGDVANSMTIHDKMGWVVVNGSNVVFAIAADTYVEKGRISTGLTSPRWMHFISDEKAYVTQMYDNRIAIVNPKTYSVTGYIDVPGQEASTGSTEMMVQVGKYVYVNCWSYQKTIIRIDTDTDKVDATLEVGVQPKSMVLDRDNNLWVLTDGGGWDGNPVGYEAPSLVKVNTRDFTVAMKLEMNLGDYTPTLAINGTRDRLYWIQNDVYTMPITSTELPATPVIRSNGNYYYGLTIDPERGDIFIADAVDYVQNGRLLRYDSDGASIGTVATGICPHAFCWKK